MNTKIHKDIYLDVVRVGSHFKTRKYVYEKGSRDWIAKKFNSKTKISIVERIFVL